MPNEFTFAAIVKPLMWFVTIVVATILLRHRKVTGKVRVSFLVGGILIFGVLFGLFTTSQFDPNPVKILRNVLTFVTGQQSPGLQASQPIMISGAVILVVLLVASWVSNKSICGWVCHLGLLQDLIYKASLPKWKPPFWLSNTVRSITSAGLLVGLIVAGLDWIGWINPFHVFRFDFSLAIGIFFVILLIASLFIYRPWCQFLCPFGLVSWIVEQFSLLRPRVNWDKCKQCRLCIKACPTAAMDDFYSGKKIHADCFACGACIDACPQQDALQWRKRISSSSDFKL